MKTSILSLFALTISAALAIPVQAGGSGHGGGGGIGFSGGGGGHISSPAHSGGSSFRTAPGPNFGGGRLVAPGQRFSSLAAPNTFRQQRMIGSNVAGRRFDGPRTFNNRESHLARNGNNSGNRFENRGANAAREHVFARRTASWHRDWDRGRDHWWHGHHCRFINGSWVIFDSGFYPWWPYWYPYDYYAYDYNPYPSSYDPGYYDSGVYQGEEYYDQNGDESSDQYTDSTVATAQERLAREGYYRGGIDGVLGPETRRAIMRYQSDHGLRVTGYLTTDTMRALGFPRVASN